MDKLPSAADAHPPRDIARMVQGLGVAKARTDTITLGVLAVLAGAFISLGALFFTVVVTGSRLGFGPTRLIGGVCFSLGLILVVVAGAELFTGNNLLAMAWASRLIGTREVLRNWLLAYLGNVLGCLGTVLCVVWAEIGSLGDGAVADTALQIARTKADLSVGEAFARGVLCNALVCLAVWLTLSARSTADRILAIVFPISAFVAAGFEHSIANLYFIPIGLLVADLGAPEFWGAIGETREDFGALSWSAMLVRNLLPVTIGNIIGGAGLVGAVYWFVYLRRREVLAS